MTRINRRNFLRLAGGSTLTAGTLGFPGLLLANTRKVVVVGGGVGGCTAAKYLRKLDPTLDVTLVEPNGHYTSCFMSNEVLSGDRTIESITFSYADLKWMADNIEDEAVREHVSLYFYEVAGRYAVGSIEAPMWLRHPEYRWTLDTKEDYEMITEIFKALFPQKPFFAAWDIVAFLERNPEVIAINKEIQQKKIRE